MHLFSLTEGKRIVLMPKESLAGNPNPVYQWMKRIFQNKVNKYM